MDIVTTERIVLRPGIKLSIDDVSAKNLIENGKAKEVEKKARKAVKEGFHTPEGK